MLVVLQHRERVLLQHRIGGIDIDEIDLFLRDGLVGETVIEPTRRRKVQRVMLLQTRPAICAANEFLRQTETQSLCRRDLRQIGNACNLARIGVGRSHRQRVSVIEAQRKGDSQRHGRELPIQFIERRHRVEPQDLLGDGAGVFGIYASISPSLEGVQHDAGITQATLMHSLGLTGRARLLCNELTEDVGLSEALGADLENRVRGHGRHSEGSMHVCNYHCDGKACLDTPRSPYPPHRPHRLHASSACSLRRNPVAAAAVIATSSGTAMPKTSCRVACNSSLVRRTRLVVPSLSECVDSWLFSKV